MSRDGSVKFSKTDLEKLQHLSNLLHLFHHRKKNQHRRSIWWRHFSTFRRQHGNLVTEVESLHEIPNTHLQRAKKKIQDRQTEDRISKRLDFWTEVLVPKWYISFSQVVADGRFTVLGLMLIAVLAQTCQVAGITSKFDETEIAAGEEAMEDLGKAQDESVIETIEKRAEGEEDLGEVVEREASNSATRDATRDATQNREATTKSREGSKQHQHDTAKMSVPRKRRKKDNAIDDLFSSLN